MAKLWLPASTVSVAPSRNIVYGPAMTFDTACSFRVWDAGAPTCRAARTAKDLFAGCGCWSRMPVWYVCAGMLSSTGRCHSMLRWARSRLRWCWNKPDSCATVTDGPWCVAWDGRREITCQSEDAQVAVPCGVAAGAARSVYESARTPDQPARAARAAALSMAKSGIGGDLASCHCGTRCCCISIGCPMSFPTSRPGSCAGSGRRGPTVMTPKRVAAFGMSNRGSPSRSFRT